jgi:ATP-dependent DNA helicase RecG
MNKEELKLILEEGEGLKVEFKECFDLKNLAKEICAFANSEGGRIFIGISDKGEIEGIEISNKLKSQIQDIANNCDPSVKIHIEAFENILIIVVEEGSNKPYQCSGGFYLREGPNSQKLSRDEILKFVTGSGKIKFDEQINENFKFPEDFNEKNFMEFLEKSDISNKDIEDVLINLSLAIRKENRIVINNAGILLFGRDIKRFIRQNFIYCTLFKGKDRVDIIDRKEFNEDLQTNYFEALNFLKKHLKLSYIIKGGGPREEVLELPLEALKEALINSIIHRDYFETGFGVNVEIFDDRVEITNWGKLLFDARELGKVSFPRNPVLFDLFYRLDMIEKAGSGINRMKQLVKERNLKVKFESSEFFRVVFFREATSEIEKSEGLNEGLNEGLKSLLELIIKNQGTKAKDASEKLTRPIKTIERQIKILTEKGLIERRGSKKTGGYYIKKRENDK